MVEIPWTKDHPMFISKRLATKYIRLVMFSWNILLMFGYKLGIINYDLHAIYHHLNMNEVFFLEDIRVTLTIYWYDFQEACLAILMRSRNYLIISLMIPY